MEEAESWSKQGWYRFPAGISWARGTSPPVPTFTSLFPTRPVGWSAPPSLTFSSRSSQPSFKVEGWDSQPSMGSSRIMEGISLSAARKGKDPFSKFSCLQKILDTRHSLHYNLSSLYQT